MKVGIVGVGSVGRACALALAGRGCAREIVLVDRTRTRTSGSREGAAFLMRGEPLGGSRFLRTANRNTSTWPMAATSR
jgi:2-polyprenyl-6-methoxyphenol hydroxylase-like FAD-dependent oxidoreductase